MSRCLESLLTAEQRTAANKADTLARMQSMATQASKDAAELAAFRGTDTKPANGCARATVSMGSASVIVEYEYEPGEAAKLYGPPEDCYEGSPDTLTMLQALINGEWCDPADFASDALLNLWEADILLQIQDAREAAAEDYAESRSHDREYA